MSSTSSRGLISRKASIEGFKTVIKREDMLRWSTKKTKLLRKSIQML